MHDLLMVDLLTYGLWSWMQRVLGLLLVDFLEDGLWSDLNLAKLGFDSTLQHFHFEY